MVRLTWGKNEGYLKLRKNCGYENWEEIGRMRENEKELEVGTRASARV